jgi:hypothetical protein
MIHYTFLLLNNTTSDFFHFDNTIYGLLEDKNNAYCETASFLMDFINELNDLLSDKKDAKLYFEGKNNSSYNHFKIKKMDDSDLFLLSNKYANISINLTKDTLTEMRDKFQILLDNIENLF